ncbi:MAG: carbohydrate ABC transporter permease [Clostridia bacterium]|nr:carbohydrate ABC transporter permease [Clostridia bacterium]
MPKLLDIVAPKRVSRSRAGDVVVFLVLLIFGLFMALPFVYAISNSLKPMNELWIFPPRFFPANPTMDNFRDLLTLMEDSWIPMSRYIFNSLFITTVGTVGHIIVASLCAYPLAKFKFPGTRLLFSVVVTSLMFSTAVTAIPNYLIMSKLFMIDSYWALLLPAMGGSLGLFLMKNFMETSIPDSLLESAEIDGANEWTKFIRIVMPLVKPAWLTLTIFSVQSLWGIGSTNMIYSEDLKTLPYALSQIQTAGIARAGVSAAVGVFMMILPLAVFIFTQSNIMETMSTSGIKE